MTKKIFALTKTPSIKEFIRDQKLLLIKEEEEKYKHVPKILAVILDRIIEIKDEENISEAQIYGYFNDLGGNWNIKKEKNLKALKTQLDIGNYLLSKETDILVLVELLYDWLSESILFVISEKNIKKIDKEVYQSISNFVQRKNLTIDSHLVIEKLKSTLTTVEFESLVCLAIFANKLATLAVDNNINVDDIGSKQATFKTNKNNTMYGTSLKNFSEIESTGIRGSFINNAEEINTNVSLYQMMLLNIIFRMLGYKELDLFHKDDGNIKKTYTVCMVVDIVNFLIYLIDYDYSDDYKFLATKNIFSKYLWFKKFEDSQNKFNKRKFNSNFNYNFDFEFKSTGFVLNKFMTYNYENSQKGEKLSLLRESFNITKNFLESVTNAGEGTSSLNSTFQTLKYNQVSNEISRCISGTIHISARSLGNGNIIFNDYYTEVIDQIFEKFKYYEEEKLKCKSKKSITHVIPKNHRHSLSNDIALKNRFSAANSQINLPRLMTNVYEGNSIVIIYL